MNNLYQKDQDIALVRRTSGNTEFEEYPLIVTPQSVLMTDSTNNVVCVGVNNLNIQYATTSSYAGVSSFAMTSSYTVLYNADSQRYYALSVSGTLGNESLHITLL